MDAVRARVQRACRIAGAAVALAVLLSLALPALQADAAAAPAFVQTAAHEVNSGTSDAVTFDSANAAGNLVVVYVIWNNTNAVTLTDSRANAYVSAAGRTTWAGGSSSQVFYAKNIAGGTNTVTARFASSVNSWAVVY